VLGTEAKEQKGGGGRKKSTGLGTKWPHFTDFSKRLGSDSGKSNKKDKENTLKGGGRKGERKAVILGLGRKTRGKESTWG